MTTLVVDPGHAPAPDDKPRVASDPKRPTVEAAPEAVPLRGGRLWMLIGIWFVVIAVSLALSIYLLEPLFQARNQSDLLESYRSDISRASNEARGLPGVSVPTKAPELGAPVAIVEIGDVRVQQVTVEGASSSQTHVGPGHVSGTAAPGQPGNAVIVGRRFGFGAPFNELGELEPGASILTTTTQGQVVYTVESVEQVEIITTDSVQSGSASTGAAIGGDEDRTDVVTVEELYGPSEDDRLTLVTSASATPWNSSRATVVVAKMEGTPFEPTPQGGRTDSATGLSGESAAWAPLALALLCFAAAAAAAIYLYRRSSFRVAYLLTTPPLIVFTILMAETISRLFPSWM